MVEELNKAMKYIEEHLEDENLAHEVLDNIECPACQFMKVFHALSGITLAEYIKNRRLSEANRRLLQGAKVIDVAFQYGYRSVDGFARAFKNWSGMLPSEVQKMRKCSTYPRMNFEVRTSGGRFMEYRIVEMPAFVFAGVSRRVPMQFEGVNMEIVKLAESITDVQKAEMHRLQDIMPYEVVNISYDSDTSFMKEEGYLTHMIGVLTTKKDIGAGLETYPMEAHTWAVFPSEGEYPSTMQNTMARIYGEWFLSSDYELELSLSFLFAKIDTKRNNYAYSEVWVPVKKRKK